MGADVVQHIVAMSYCMQCAIHARQALPSASTLPVQMRQVAKMLWNTDQTCAEIRQPNNVLRHAYVQQATQHSPTAASTVLVNPGPA